MTPSRFIAAMALTLMAVGAQADDWTVRYTDMRPFFVSGPPIGDGAPFSVTVAFSGTDLNTNGLIDRAEVSRMTMQWDMDGDPLPVYPLVSLDDVIRPSTHDSRLDAFTFDLGRNSLIDVNARAVSRSAWFDMTDLGFTWSEHNGTWSTRFMEGVNVSVTHSPSPVPENSTLSLWLLGSLGLLGVLRRSKAARAAGPRERMATAP